MKKNKKELILYLVFGILTTLVSWGSYALFVRLCGASVAVANTLSWILSVAFAFVTNKIWVFDSKEWHVKLLLKEISAFVLSRALTGAVELLGVPLLAKTGFDGIFMKLFKSLGLQLGVLYTDGIYSKIAFAVIVVVLNYVFSKLIVFKKKN